jgi:hypothetical protein
MKDLDPAEPIRRYERETPGELIHIDIKKLAESTASAIASPATGGGKAIVAGGWAGTSPTSASTTPLALPSP